MKMSKEFETLGKKLVILYNRFDDDSNVIDELRDSMEQIIFLDSQIISDRALGFKNGLELLKKEYMDMDSGNGAYIVKDYDYQKIKEGLKEFITFYYGGLEVV